MQAYSNMNLKRNFSSQLRFSFTAELSRNQMDNETNRLADTIQSPWIALPVAFNKLTNQPTDRETDRGKLYSYYHVTRGYTLELNRQGQRAQLKSFVVLVKEEKCSSNMD